jgi:hypothetical protein
MVQGQEEDTSVPDEDPELILLTKRKNKVMDEASCATLQKISLGAVTLVICIYFTLTCDSCLLLIMMLSACCCMTNPYFILPFMFSLVAYAVSHQRTIHQAFTIGEDIYTFNDKYK